MEDSIIIPERSDRTYRILCRKSDSLYAMEMTKAISGEDNVLRIFAEFRSSGVVATEDELYIVTDAYISGEWHNA